MKIKALYIYLGIIVIALVTIIFISNIDEQEKNIAGDEVSQIPDDDIHQSFESNGQPSSTNVTPEFKSKMNELDSYIAENPSDTVKLREYAELLAAAHNEDKAVELYNKILKIDKNRIDVLTQLAILHFNKSDFIKANEYLTKILNIDPQNLQAKYNLGVVEARIGDIAAAKKQWEDLLKNHPNTKMSDMAKESLEKLAEK
jgi:tetratricopeptide (TPR) repeat protein